MENGFADYLDSQVELLTRSLDGNGVAVLVGIYGIGKGLVLDRLQASSSIPVVRLAFKDFRPDSSPQVYKMVLDQLKSHKIVLADQAVPASDFEAHYLIKQAISEKPFLLVLQDAHQLLHLPDSFWDNLESLRYYQELQVVISGQPQLLYTPTPGLIRFTKSHVVFAKLLTKPQTSDYLRSQHQISDDDITIFAYRYSHGHIGTIKFLLNQIKSHNPQSLNRHTFEILTSKHPLISVWLELVLNSLSPQARHLIHQSLSHNLTAKIRSTPEFKSLSNLQLMRHENFTFKEFANHILPLINSTSHSPKLHLIGNAIHFGTTDISLSITKIQTQILKTMLTSPSGFISYDQIGDIVWGKGATENYSLQAINQHMSRLKKKLTFLGLSKQTIGSLRGRGYLLSTLSFYSKG